MSKRQQMRNPFTKKLLKPLVAAIALSTASLSMTGWAKEFPLTLKTLIWRNSSTSLART